MVGSSSKCKLRNNIKEDLDGSLEVKFLPLSLVDFLDDGPYFIVRYMSDVCSLRDYCLISLLAFSTAPRRVPTHKQTFSDL